MLHHPPLFRTLGRLAARCVAAGAGVLGAVGIVQLDVGRQINVLFNLFTARIVHSHRNQKCSIKLNLILMLNLVKQIGI